MSQASHTTRRALFSAGAAVPLIVAGAAAAEPAGDLAAMETRRRELDAWWKDPAINDGTGDMSDEEDRRWRLFEEQHFRMAIAPCRCRSDALVKLALLDVMISEKRCDDQTIGDVSRTISDWLKSAH